MDITVRDEDFVAGIFCMLYILCILCIPYIPYILYILLYGYWFSAEPKPVLFLGL